MLERIDGLPGGIEGVRAVGKVKKEDYEATLAPVLDAARREGKRVRFLYEMGPEFEGFTGAGAWEDAKLGLRSIQQFDGCAVVTDVGWVRQATRLAAFMMPCPVKIFGVAERDAAVQWLQTLPEGPGISFRLLPESGVLVVEVSEALRVQDFDALSIAADAWIEGHGKLQGLVIHAREFPGWENLGGFLRHLRFVRDHHRLIQKIALVSDGKLASVAPELGEHFVDAEVKTFGYSALENAIAWAAGPPAPLEPKRGRAAPTHANAG